MQDKTEKTTNVSNSNVDSSGGIVLGSLSCSKNPSSLLNPQNSEVRT